MLSFYRRTLDIVLRHQFITLVRLLRHHGVDRGDDRHDPQGLLPDPGHRPDLGLRRGRAGHRARADDAHHPRVRRRAPARSGRRRLRLVHRQHRRRPDRQYRPLLHRAQAARRARAHVFADHRPAAAAARQGQGREPVPAADAGHHRGRPHLPRQLPVHAAGFQRRRAQRVVGQAAGEDAHAAADRRRRRAISWRMRRSSRSPSIATRRRASASRRR